MLLVERLWSRIAVGAADACWPWQAGRSRGGEREVDYGSLRQGKAGTPDTKCWRVNRLVLLLKTAPADIPRDESEAFEDWLRRADRHYRGLDASHLCDVSLCCNPAHLEWQDHCLNVKQQRDRRRARREEAA